LATLTRLDNKRQTLSYDIKAITMTKKCAVITGITGNAVTGQYLYIRNTTAQAAAATADVFIYGYDLTFLP
jgi:hypothetical protein